MKIDFYYWGVQCPLIYDMLALFEQNKPFFTVILHNIEHDFETAVRQKMYFPFLTVVDDEKRYFDPITADFLSQLRQGISIVEKPYLIPLGRKKYKGRILPLTQATMEVAGQCTGKKCAAGCVQKSVFLECFAHPVYGFLNVEPESGKLLGGAEYLPSKYVPYDIPKEDGDAFLTCSYCSAKEFDYKAYPLEELEGYLKGRFDKLWAISDETGTFPNGDLQWFLSQGYDDCGILSVEEGYCRLHLVGKNL